MTDRGKLHLRKGLRGGFPNAEPGSMAVRTRDFGSVECSPEVALTPRCSVRFESALGKAGPERPPANLKWERGKVGTCLLCWRAFILVENSDYLS